MTKANSPTSTTRGNSVKGDKKKKSILPKIFSSKKSSVGSSNGDVIGSDGNETSPEREASRDIEGLNLSSFDRSTAPETEIKEFRMFVATWNVGGKTPNDGLDLEDFLQVEGSVDIYVCGFQEIVPLSAGNVLVTEDNEPAAKWLALINQALNKPQHDSDFSFDSSNNNHSKDSKPNRILDKSSLKVFSKNLKADSSLLKMCNCVLEYSPTKDKQRARKLCDPLRNSGPVQLHQDRSSHDLLSTADKPLSPISPTPYNLVASKQMVGIFLSVWAKKELVPHIGHLGFSSVGRGIMGCLGNKGCISISMSLHQTSFCFVCSHLASGEREGDELRRNADVAEILKSTEFPKICKIPFRRIPERITDHDRIIWLGDLNYRVALSYEETRILLEGNDWDTLLEKDQLNIERVAGRVFAGFSEGKILFAPTYKYSHNSDSYSGETVKSKKKRRTPAWCDRILWRGDGIEQLAYIRGESRFSDHRPVCSVFSVEVEMKSGSDSNNRLRKRYSCAAARLDFEECFPQRLSLYELQ